MISTIGVNTQKSTLQEVIQQWKDRIVCYPPSGQGYSAYLIDPNSGDRLKYIEASCDSLRHNATNYDQLLIDIKVKYTGIYKEAILNTIKYEATRRAFKAQHQWIHDSYQALIKEVKSNNFNQQMVAKIDSLNKLIAIRDRELKNLKSQCQGSLQELQAEYQKLLIQLEKEKKHRQKLGQSNKSLGAYKGQFRKAQQKISALKQENIVLKKRVKTLEGEREKLLAHK
jgi:hypothetical protein